MFISAVTGVYRFHPDSGEITNLPFSKRVVDELEGRMLNCKELTGDSAAIYVRKMRLFQARRMLESMEDSSVPKISKAAGFSNVSYFSKAFNEEFGIDPSDYLT